MKNIFFPFGINLWNLLPEILKSKQTLSSFKYHLKKKDKPKKYYYYGKRLNAIHHARLRLGCSNLNGHLALIMHVIENPNCKCGNIVVSPKHFFLECPLFAGPRVNLIQEVSKVTDCTINKLLFGDNTLSSEQNFVIVQAVHTYFDATKRFEF